MKRFPIVMFLVLVLAGAGGAFAQGDSDSTQPGPIPALHPVELALKRAGSTDIDLRLLPRTPPVEQEREELEDPELHPIELPGAPTGPAIPSVDPTRNAQAPAPLNVYEGLDRFNWGAGSPPDTNGDVGPTYYIQTVNTSLAIYRKSDGFQEAAFTYNTFMSQGAFGNLCDTNNFGDPVVLYDSFEDRWVATDFAFLTDISGNVVAPAFQCFAVSKTGNPLTGGWNFYSIQITDALNDYPKFGVWPDGIYMSANMFGFGAGGSFQGSRAWAFNKAQMYAGAPTVQIVSFNIGGGDFTVIPSNARLQTGTPPPGTPNYFVSTWLFTNALSVYKFHVDWNSIGLSTLTGPDTPLAATNWPNAAVANAGQPGTATLLDVLQIRNMVQSQYTNFSGVESLWNTHTVRRFNTSGFAAPRWYQMDVTGGTVAANLVQAATWDPDGANVINRFMPSLALDRGGNMALGYSTSVAAASGSETGATIFPSIRYAGRLSTDTLNTFGETEQVLFTGTASQTGTSRWGDYSSMTLDPDGCTFWYTSEYANPADQTFNHRWLTKFGSFKYAECTPVGGGGTLSGTVIATVGGLPISGATVTLGARVTTTDGSGNYQFLSLPAGTYPSITASAPGYTSASVTSLVVTDGGTTDQDFSLGTAPTSACLTDTTQSDFQLGVQTKVDVTTSPGDVTLTNKPTVDQSNTAGTNTGTGFATTSWAGQTFTAGVSAPLVAADTQVFCNPCSATPPDLTLSLRATSGGFPTGADLASVTIPGATYASGATVLFTATFGSPFTVASGTQYALILRPAAVDAGTSYFWIRASPSSYAGGNRVISVDGGGTFTADLTRDFNFKTYMDTGYTSPGNQVSRAMDSNPAVGLIPNWTTFSFNNTTPTNTAMTFQVAASNSPYGPFAFVGPDGTAGTFFTSGASLSQFDGKRYLKYQAVLTSSSGAVTPTLNDVTLCYTDLTPADLSLTKSDGGATVAPGGTATYTLTYGNAGGSSSTGVVITDTVPANSTFNSGASTAGWACAPDNNPGSVCTLAVPTVAGGASGLTATYAVTAVSAPVAAGINQISNTASIADDGVHGVDPTPGDNSGSDTTPLTATPDLTITKDDGSASVSPGGTVAYTLTYANAGNQGATGVVLTETVPANTTFNSGASTAGWSCTPDNNAGSTCTLAIGALAAGSGNQTATFAVTVDSLVASGVTQISNTASIADDGNNGTDPTPGDNSGSDTTPVTATPDLNISKSDGGASVLAGGTASYTLSYSNVGNQGATGVVITETVPANTTFNAGASTAGWSCTPDNNAGSTCTLAIGGVAASSGTLTATFAVTVDSPATGVTSISNTASIADDGNNGTEPTPGDNSSTDTTPVGNLDYYTLTPCRLVDTRNAAGPYGAPPLAALSTRTFVAWGQCGVPTNAQAISLNITVLNGTSAGDLRSYPTGVAAPLTSVINYSAGQTRANNAVVALGGTLGDFVVQCDQPTGTVDVIIDVNGYFKQ